MSYNKPLISHLMVIVAFAAAICVSTAARALTQCEFVSQLKRFEAQAEILVQPNITPRSSAAQTAIRNLEELIRISEGKEEYFPSYAFESGHDDWLYYFIIAWKKYLSAFKISGTDATVQLFYSQRYRHFLVDIEEIWQSLGCDSVGSGGAERPKGVLARLQALSGGIIGSGVSIDDGSSGLLAWEILGIVVALVSLSLWGVTWYDRYRKDCAKRFYCDAEALIKFRASESHANISDISRSGAALLVEFPVKRGEILWINLENKMRKSRIIWVGNSKIGIRFTRKLKNIPQNIKAGQQRKRNTT